jgi:hypothetical protein
MPSKSTDELIVEKLDTLIRLQARIAVCDLATQKDKILFLDSAGLGPKAIGEILGTSANHASVTLAQARKGKKGPEAKAGTKVAGV